MVYDRSVLKWNFNGWIGLRSTVDTRGGLESWKGPSEKSSYQGLEGMKEATDHLNL